MLALMAHFTRTKHSAIARNDLYCAQLSVPNKVCLYAKLTTESAKIKYYGINIIDIAIIIIIAQIFSFVQWLAKRSTMNAEWTST